MRRLLAAALWLLIGTGLVAISGYSLVAALNSPPQTFTASVSADTYISSYAPASVKGTSADLWISKEGNNVNWTLVQFQTAGRLRNGDLVTSATIRFAVSGVKGGPWPQVVTTARTLTNWSEKTTFGTPPLFSFDTSTATAIGVSGTPVPGAIITVDATKQLVRWHSYGGPSNFGTALMIISDTPMVGISLASRENVQLAAPSLEVVFHPGPQTIYGYAVTSGSGLAATWKE